MRILFLVLVLANVAAYAWFSHYAEVIGPPPAPVVANVGKLLLLSERRATSSPRAMEPPQGQGLCYRAGPFPTPAQARAWLQALAKTPRSQRLEAHPERVAAGYWVRWPQSLPLHEARAVYRELRRKGVADIAITPAGEGLYVVSLGVYRLEGTLKERRAELAALGYEPEVVKRFKEVRNYWLHLEFAPPPPAPAPPPGLEQVPCQQQDLATDSKLPKVQ